MESPIELHEADTAIGELAELIYARERLLAARDEIDCDLSENARDIARVQAVVGDEGGQAGQAWAAARTRPPWRHGKLVSHAAWPNPQRPYASPAGRGAD